MSHFDKLREFRNKAYMLMGNGRDALFDLMDAVLVSRSPLPSIPCGTAIYAGLPSTIGTALLSNAYIGPYPS